MVYVGKQPIQLTAAILSDDMPVGLLKASHRLRAS